MDKALGGSHLRKHAGGTTVEPSEETEHAAAAEAVAAGAGIFRSAGGVRSDCSVVAAYAADCAIWSAADGMEGNARGSGARLLARLSIVAWFSVGIAGFFIVVGRPSGR